MVAVPVLSPCRDLKRAEPPDVLAGVDAFRQTGFEMEQAVDEGLHVQAIDESNCAEPEESSPAKEKEAECE